MLCSGKGCCCCSKNAVLFKLSLLGFIFSGGLMVGGLFWPLSILVVPIPMAWALGLLILLSSMVAYYNVRDGFWAEVEAWMKTREKLK